MAARVETASSLFPEAPAGPAGFAYRAGLVSAAEEALLIDQFERLPFAPFDFRGFKGNRRTVSFGSRYDFTRARVEDADRIPDWLQLLKRRAAVFAAVDDGALTQAMVTEYAPGAGIGWHRDRPEYGKVVGVSFGSPCVLRLRRKMGDRWIRDNIPVEPRSVYLLDGEVREAWQHSIAPGERLRYSVTFRTLRSLSGPAAARFDGASTQK